MVIPGADFQLIFRNWRSSLSQNCPLPNTTSAIPYQQSWLGNPTLCVLQLLGQARTCLPKISYIPLTLNFLFQMLILLCLLGSSLGAANSYYLPQYSAFPSSYPAYTNFLGSASFPRYYGAAAIQRTGFSYSFGPGYNFQWRWLLKTLFRTSLFYFWCLSEVLDRVWTSCHRWLWLAKMKRCRKKRRLRRRWWPSRGESFSRLLPGITLVLSHLHKKFYPVCYHPTKRILLVLSHKQKVIAVYPPLSKIVLSAYFRKKVCQPARSCFSRVFREPGVGQTRSGERRGDRHQQWDIWIDQSSALSVTQVWHVLMFSPVYGVSQQSLFCRGSWIAKDSRRKRSGVAACLRSPTIYCEFQRSLQSD